MTYFIFAGDMLVMLFMVILVVWVFWRASDETITESARIPLDDEKVGDREIGDRKIGDEKTNE